MSLMEDKWLGLRCKAGDTEALRRIWDKYGHDLLVLAVSIVKDVHLAEDILQDVFAGFIGKPIKVPPATA